MRSPHNAAWDTLHELDLADRMTESVANQSAGDWIVTFTGLSGSPVVEIQVTEVENSRPIVHVLRNTGGRALMARLSTRLAERLISSPPSERSPVARQLAF